VKHPMRREQLPTMTEIITATFRAGVTYRRYGMKGELRRPMIHRFPAEKLKCAGSVSTTLVAESVRRNNSLLDRLIKHGDDVIGIDITGDYPHGS
jgi:hypothetical protein